MQSIADWAGIAADVATVLAFLAVIVGFGFGWRQFRASQASQRELHAKSHFIEFLKLSLAYPDAAAYRHRDGDPEPPEDFQIFCGLMLNSFEHILDSCADREWEFSLMLYLRQHRGFLGSETFRRSDRDGYDPKLLVLIDRVLAEPLPDVLPKA